MHLIMRCVHKWDKSNKEGGEQVILMGMYTTVMGEEIKYGGLFAKTAAAAGIAVVKDGRVRFTKNEVIGVLTDIFHKLRAGIDLGMEYGTAFGFRKLATDAHRLALLQDWVALSNRDTLTFT